MERVEEGQLPLPCPCAAATQRPTRSLALGGSGAYLIRIRVCQLNDVSDRGITLKSCTRH